MSKQAIAAARQVGRELHGVVVSAGLMQKTVKVRVGGQQWKQAVQKMFTKPKNYLVHDPNSSLRTGDVVSIVPGWRTSPHKRHVVKNIIAPHGTPISERPPIPSEEERIAAQVQKREAKVARRILKKQEGSTETATSQA
ncbi:37S ribosomal protein S17, mitochondrial [Colletotrichum spaethianum]|uniref:37S ribosomal protein S17, mitochondrial n=1 Tax=Colletotrichum spaethianum TaxID=700344 RepID=A0AA37P6K8_9PEZI|nr:37S ribosomal protein S17, mitochondrial [Colletotrichum spaethianum]GKT39919.1 37S ribosomal protein S17, mitochondrial [Colletotrichum spaethianum]